MAKIVTLHESDALTLPLAGGAALRATPFRETARVALTLFGPGGGAGQARAGSRTGAARASPRRARDTRRGASHHGAGAACPPAPPRRRARRARGSRAGRGRSRATGRGPTRRDRRA